MTFNFNNIQVSNWTLNNQKGQNLDFIRKVPLIIENLSVEN